MFFQKIDPREYDKVRDAQLRVSQINARMKKLTEHLEEVFSHEDIKEEWGVSFVPAADGLSAAIDSPFGRARVVVAVGFENTVNIIGTYIFEKLVRSPGSGEVYSPAWAIHVDGDGVVSAQDGSGTFFRLSSISQSEIRNGVAEIALSALYSIAKEPIYLEPADENLYE